MRRKKRRVKVADASCTALCGTLAFCLCSRGRKAFALTLALTMMRTMASIAAHLPTHGTGVEYAHARSTVSALHWAGMPILAGTDANAAPASPAPIHHGQALHDELQLLVEAELTPVEALRCATVVPAEFFGFTDRGVIEAGHRADLLLIDGTTSSPATFALWRLTRWFLQTRERLSLHVWSA
jgi:imidazolonepropionase-like amidohydrolase